MNTNPSSEQAQRSLVFALASCQYPPGLLDRDLADRTLHKLAGLERTGRPRFLIRVGDQIYADATAGLFDPAQLDQALVGAYESAMLSEGAGAVRTYFWVYQDRMSGIYTMLDDHEISDNWEPEPGSSENAARLEEACAAYVKKCRAEPNRPGSLPGYAAGTALWYKETDAWTGHRFFFADSRTMRTPRNALTLDSASILGPTQWSALRTWLREGPADRVNFVATPAIVLPRRLSTSTQPAAALHSDAWDGYPASLHAMLACVCDEARAPVVFLSGDEHLSCAAKIEVSRQNVPESTVVAYSIHSSALYAPYPFANGREENFARKERFVFAHPDDSGTPVWYECRVETWFPEPVDGVAVIALSTVAGGHRLEVAFHAGHAAPDSPPQRWSAHLPTS